MYMMVYFRCPSTAVGQSALADDLASEAPSEVAGAARGARPLHGRFLRFIPFLHAHTCRLHGFSAGKKHPPSAARACRGSEQADTFARLLTDL